MLTTVLKVVDADGDEMVVEKTADGDGVLVSVEGSSEAVVLTPEEARTIAAHLMALAKEVDGGN